MSKRVKVEGVGYVTFPDDMDDAAMGEAIDSMMPKKGNPGTGNMIGDTFAGIGSGVFSTVRGAARLTGADKLLPQSGREFLDKLATPPDTMAGGLGKGVEQAGELMLLPGPKIKMLAKAPGMIKTGAEMLMSGGTSAAGTAVQTGGDVDSTLTAGTIGGLAPGISKAFQKAGPAVREWGNKLYERVLTPGGGTRAAKSITQDAAPELIKRGLMAITNNGFTRKVEDQLLDAGKAVEAAEDLISKTFQMAPIPAGTAGRTVQPPPGMVSVMDIVKDLTARMDGYKIGGIVPTGAKVEYDALKKVRKDLLKLGPVMEFSDLVKLRRSWDQSSGKYKSGIGDPNVKGMANALSQGADAIRTWVGNKFPQMASANKEYSFLAGVNKVIKDASERQVGHGRGLATTMVQKGAAASAAGGAASAVEAMSHATQAYLLVGAVDSFMKSPAYKTTTAVALDKLGRMMQSGKYANALKYTGLLMQQGNRKDATPADAAPQAQAQPSSPAANVGRMFR